jgi:hypothetical protein
MTWGNLGKIALLDLAAVGETKSIRCFTLQLGEIGAVFMGF